MGPRPRRNVLNAPRYATLAVAWLRPNSLWPLVVVLPYCRYFLVVLDQAQPTADTYLAWLLAAGAPGIWFGHCARDARVWPSALLVPHYTRTLTSLVMVAMCVALVFSAAAAWLGGLAPWDSVTYGALTINVALLAGYHFRFVALIVLALAGFALAFVIRDSGTFAPAVALPLGGPVVAALLGILLLGSFLYGVRRPLVEDPWRFPARLRRLGLALGTRLLSNGVVRPPWRTMSVFAVTAFITASMVRYSPISLHSLEWAVLAGALTLTTFGGQSSSFPQGKLAAATSLLLLGAGDTRTAVVRQIMWRTIGDSCLGVATFMAVSLALAAETRLYEAFAALTACHLYLLGASGFKWLLSSRGSILVAMPCVAFLTWLGGKLLPMGLPAAIVAFIATALGAVHWGSRRMARLDFV